MEELQTPPIQAPSWQDAYQHARLRTSQKQISIILLIGGALNLLLLVPDVALTGNGSSLPILIVRGVFSLFIFALVKLIKHVRTFRMFSAVVSACELGTIAIFLFVLSRYPNPDLMIQTLGMIIIVLLVFLAPNLWGNMLAIALIGSVAFFCLALIYMKNASPMNFAASAVYIALTVLLCAISAWNTERYRAREFAAKTELERLSTTDYLTGTCNRLKLEEEADRWIAYCQRQQLPLSLVFMDIDNLKLINDNCGHPAGDAVLLEVSKLVRAQVRGSDILCRWGGDEFVLLLPNMDGADAAALTERIRSMIENKVFLGHLRVTCSFGVLQMKPSSTLKRLVYEADALMYKGKSEGRNNVQRG